MTQSGGSPQLEYAPRSPKPGLWRIYRWVIVVAIFFAVYFCRGWPVEIWQHFRMLYFQQQCIKLPIPARTIVYSSGRPEVAVVSPQWAAFAAVDPNKYQLPGKKSASTVFMGELQASNGIRRFVEVESYTNWKPKGFSDVMFFMRSIQLGATTPLQENIQPGGGPTCNASPFWPGIVPDIVVYSATRDKSDASHISFECRIFQADYIVDGYLGADGRFTLTKWNYTAIPVNAKAR